MENIKEMYDFVTRVWQFVKHTEAPAQDDNTTWDEIITTSNNLCREFTVKMTDWMELLRDQSIEEGQI